MFRSNQLKCVKPRVKDLVGASFYYYIFMLIKIQCTVQFPQVWVNVSPSVFPFSEYMGTSVTLRRKRSKSWWKMPSAAGEATYSAKSCWTRCQGEVRSGYLRKQTTSIISNVSVPHWNRNFSGIKKHIFAYVNFDAGCVLYHTSIVFHCTNPAKVRRW